IIFACALMYAVLTGFNAAIGWSLLIVLGGLMLIAETADNWLTAVGAKRYGASKTSMWLSFFGGLFGAIVLGSPLAFITGPLGPVIGGFAGAFLIVVGYEYSQRLSLCLRVFVVPDGSGRIDPLPSFSSVPNFMVGLPARSRCNPPPPFRGHRV